MNRSKIVKLLHKKPSNALQIANKLKVNYKTATHHLDVLSKYELVTATGQYGKTYFLTPLMEKYLEKQNV